MAVKNTIKTDYDELFAFAKTMNKYSDEIEREINLLKKDTDDTMAFSWKGEKADEFAEAIRDSSNKIEKKIGTLRELSSAIEEKATMLKEANEKRKFRQ